MDACYEDKFLVRTHCATYNHENYITDALEGFVMQETTFPVVYTIIDDASTDRTAEVIRQFVSENFVLNTASDFEKETDYGCVTFAQHRTNKNCWFAVIYLKENHFSQKKSKTPYLKEWADTKYIALCEGDDYWTDPLKLQKQVDFLEKHAEFSMCSHAALWKKNGELNREGCQHNEECALSSDEVIRYGGLYLATASLVFRKELADDWPEWRKCSDVGDYPLQILGTLRRGLYFFPDCMCVYRFQLEGSWTLMKKQVADVGHLRNEISWLELLDEETGYLYTEAVHFHLFPYYASLYRQREVSFIQYYRSAKLSHFYLCSKKMFKDLFYRNCYPIYRLFKKG